MPLTSTAALCQMYPNVPCRAQCQWQSPRKHDQSHLWCKETVIGKSHGSTNSKIFQVDVSDLYLFESKKTAPGACDVSEDPYQHCKGPWPNCTHKNIKNQQKFPKFESTFPNPSFLKDPMSQIDETRESFKVGTSPPWALTQGHFGHK